MIAPEPAFKQYFFHKAWTDYKSIVELGTKASWDLLDGVIQVEGPAAMEFARQSAAKEGLLVGISSGATLAAIAQKLPDLPVNTRVLGFNYDTGERYLSIEGFLPA